MHITAVRVEGSLVVRSMIGVVTTVVIWFVILQGHESRAGVVQVVNVMCADM